MTEKPIRCIHRHTIESHPSCFAKGLILEANSKDMEKRIRTEHNASPYKRVNVGQEPWYLNPEYTVGYFDIETSNFTANNGFMVSYAFKAKGSDAVVYNEITQQEILSKEYDKRLVRECIRDMRAYRIIVTYYGSGFDIPFLRTRALYWYQRLKLEKQAQLEAHNVTDLRAKLEALLPEDRRVPTGLKKATLIDLLIDRDAELLEFEFPSLGELYHWDLYYVVKRTIKTHRKSLGVVTEFFGIEGKTHLKPEQWQDVRIADPAIMPTIREHNEEDVVILEKLHEILNPYKKWSRTNL